MKGENDCRESSFAPDEYFIHLSTSERVNTSSCCSSSWKRQPKMIASLTPILLVFLFHEGSSGVSRKNLFSGEMLKTPDSMVKYSSFNLLPNVAKRFSNSTEKLQKERNFRAAIGYGLTFKRELEELEKLLVVKGLVTKLFDSNDFSSQYFSSSRDDNVQKLIHNGIASSAITRYYTIQTYP